MCQPSPSLEAADLFDPLEDRGGEEKSSVPRFVSVVEPKLSLWLDGTDAVSMLSSPIDGVGDLSSLNDLNDDVREGVVDPLDPLEVRDEDVFFDIPDVVALLPLDRFDPFDDEDLDFLLLFDLSLPSPLRAGPCSSSIDTSERDSCSSDSTLAAITARDPLG